MYISVFFEVEKKARRKKKKEGMHLANARNNELKDQHLLYKHNT